MIKNNNKGIALIWALIAGSLILLISGSMATTVMKESGFSMKIEDSTKAYAAARSGIEWAEKTILSSATAVSGSSIIYIDPAKTVSATVTYTKTASGWDYKSVGNVNVNLPGKIISRTLEYTSSENVANKAKIGNNFNPYMGPFLGVYGTFSMQFDFTALNNAGNITVGIWDGKVSGTSARRGVFANINGTNSTISLFALKDGVRYDGDKTFPFEIDAANYYRYRLYLNYTQGVGASLRLVDQTAEGGSSSSCSAGDLINMGLSGVDFGVLSMVYTNNWGYAQYQDNYAVVSSYLVISGMYIDGVSKILANLTTPAVEAGTGYDIYDNEIVYMYENFEYGKYYDAGSGIYSLPEGTWDIHNWKHWSNGFYNATAKLLRTTDTSMYPWNIPNINGWSAFVGTDYITSPTEQQAEMLFMYREPDSAQIFSLPAGNYALRFKYKIWLNYASDTWATIYLSNADMSSVYAGFHTQNGTGDTGTGSDHYAASVHGTDSIDIAGGYSTWVYGARYKAFTVAADTTLKFSVNAWKDIDDATTRLGGAFVVIDDIVITRRY